MEAQHYDLFEIVPGGHPRWIGVDADLEHAKTRLKELAEAASAVDYFVREFRSGNVVAIAPRPRTTVRISELHSGSAAGCA